MFEQTEIREKQIVRERSIIRNVYLWMTAGLILTGVSSLWMLGSQERMISLIRSGFLWALLIGELIFVFVISSKIMSMSPMTATLCFGAYAFLNGITLSVVFYAYTAESLASVFFITAGTFGAMSIYAATSKKDLSGWGQYLMMGLWGLIIASVVNIFMKSSSFSYMISYIGVLIFCGLTAFDTQFILRMSRSCSSSIDETDYVRFSIIGALKLYLDFINMFLYFLRIFGRSRE